MSIIIVIKDNKTKKKNSHKKSSDESELSSAKELQYTKKKKIINNLTIQVQISQIPTTSIPIVIQLLSQFYQHFTFHNTNANLASPNTLPSIGKFLNSLDHKHNCDVYSNFENAFCEEEITVNIIKDLSDEQLQQLKVVKIGWQKNIKQVA
ncbi:hypothetical protein C1645_821220 [Glomus cerebriforme]|uniref:SAM domain-containing protein n=1 Tax=Glomus cerebriforme TaxID=658196 RepID=A0A397T2M2_9GLOM|nr:hypothetical protein C1645_821220 [Glomus cerebriforme]